MCDPRGVQALDRERPIKVHLLGLLLAFNVRRPLIYIYNIFMPVMELFFFGFTLWLGAYLLARNSQKATVQLTGWGLVAYALALAIQILFDQFPLTILLAPALLWIGAALHLLPEEDTARSVLTRIWMLSSIPLAILTLVNPWFALAPEAKWAIGITAICVDIFATFQFLEWRKMR